MKERKSDNANLASEFLVASLLNRRGYIVTLTLGHTKEIDLIVARPHDAQTVTIDVKGLKNTTNWPLNPKKIRKTHFFVLVSYRNKFADLRSSPDFFVIPSTHLKPGKSKLLTRWTGNRKVICVRYSKVKDSKYKNAWWLLFGDRQPYDEPNADTTPRRLS